MEREFNLLDENWIRVRLPNAQVQAVSLREALLRAHEFTDLAGEIQTQDAAMLRLLLAVLHAVFSRSAPDGSSEPLSTEEDALDRWRELWALGHLPPEPLEAYFARWRDRFWLFDKERPFYQVPEAAKGSPYSAAKLNGALMESGNKLRLFSERSDKDTLTYAEAARWLLHVIAFDDTSAKPKQKGLPSPGAGWLGKLGLMVLKGNTLFETLLLNLTLLRNGNELWAYDAPGPIWELDEPRAEERVEISQPKNPAALLTLQSRRILLTRKGGSVTGYTLLGGDFFEKTNAFQEQMTLWSGEKAKGKGPSERVPKRHDHAKQLWREFSTLTSRGEENARPGLMMWLSTLMDEEYLPVETMVRIQTAAVQYGDKDFFVKDAFADELTLHANLLSQVEDAWRERIIAETKTCDEVAKAVGRLARDIYCASGGSSDEDTYLPVMAEGRARFYSAIDLPFRAWLAERSATEDDAAWERAFKAWHSTARRLALDLGNQMVQEAGTAAILGKVIRKEERETRYSAAEAYGRYQWEIMGKHYPKEG